jgi:hypothetical protein
MCSTGAGTWAIGVAQALRRAVHELKRKSDRVVEWIRMGPGPSHISTPLLKRSMMVSR